MEKVKQGGLNIITTDEKNNVYWQAEKTAITPVQDSMCVINLYPDIEYQTFKGFGGAFTEAAAHVYSQMGESNKAGIMEALFGESGLRYNIGRIHMNSCDFSLGNYVYIDEGDDTLATFDISHDEKEIIPMIKDAQEKAGTKIELLMSPWSPPAFMKTNNDMNNGGSLKPQYASAWAEYFVKYIKAFRNRGMEIKYLTVQNEPMAVQTWDSCIYTAQEEGNFVKSFLAPALIRNGLDDVGIFVWDHNKEEAVKRFRDVLFDKEVERLVRGEALHWYTGDHFEAIELLRRLYPDKEIFFTEGCVEYSRFADSDEIKKAEMYAHDIIGNLNAGINASLDWNLLLDENGGPNHVGNFCAAPIMAAHGGNMYEKRLSYYYIGHFSRFIKKGAKRIGLTRYTDAVEATAFLNPDGTKTVVILNKTEKEIPYTLREWVESEQMYMGIERRIAPHSIQTIILQAADCKN